MILLKLMLSNGRGKAFVSKWIKDKLYLKFGARADIKLNDISLIEEDGKVQFRLNIEADCTSDEFYDILEKLAK